MVGISNPSSGTSVVTLSNLTITNGSACASGACILSGGGGISNLGVLTINYSTLSGNIAIARNHSYGGGLVNSGTVTINNRTLSGNTAGCGTTGCASYGGGIYNYGGGTVMISNSTLAGNVANAHFNNSEGGGIANLGSLTISNSTFSGNRANRGAGIFNGGALTVNNGTLSGNNVYLPGAGGGIYNNNGSAALQNSIVANNSSGNCSGTMSSKGYNLSSDNTCAFSGTGDLNNTDPKLGTLGSYGGPTQTIPPLSGSLAIDAGNPGGCTDTQGNLLKTDQRGMPRPDPPEMAGCDRGAYES